LPRALEASPIDNLRRQHHRPLQRDPAKALEPRDRGGECRRKGQLLNLPID